MTDKTNNLIVSFCIPVYNNAEAAERLVKGILRSDSMRFEVVVSDDASSDDCKERLSHIHDSRFRYYRNEKNLGAHKNWEHALELGQGEYLFLSMGRDRLHHEGINRLIEILEYAHENNITLLQDGYSGNGEIRIYDGIDAMIHFLNVSHPTGSIFSRKLFREIPDRTKYFDISDMYPENYVRRDMLLHGKAASIMSGTYVYPDPIIDMAKIKSTVESGKSLYDMFCAPRRRTVLFFELMDIAEPELSQRFNEYEVNKYIGAKFLELLNYVSITWHISCRNHEWQAHYGQKIKHISISEMIRNIFTARHDALVHLKEKGIYTPSRQRIMNYCMIKIIVKIFMYRLLEPLGICAVLMKIKHLIKG